jgi:hypothetical protein
VTRKSPGLVATSIAYEERPQLLGRTGASATTRSDSVHRWAGPASPPSPISPFEGPPPLVNDQERFGLPGPRSTLPATSPTRAHERTVKRDRGDMRQLARLVARSYPTPRYATKTAIATHRPATRPGRIEGLLTAEAGCNDRSIPENRGEIRPFRRFSFISPSRKPNIDERQRERRDNSVLYPEPTSNIIDSGGGHPAYGSMSAPPSLSNGFSR